MIYVPCHHHAVNLLNSLIISENEMKKAFLQCMFIFLILTPKTLSQCIYSDDLDSPDWGVRFEALEQMAEKGLVECLEDIHDRIFEQPHLTLSFAFLQTLDRLEDPEIEGWALQFIEEADNLQPDPLAFKVQATKILFDK